MKHWIKIILAIICVLVVDLTTKHFLSDVEYFNLIPHVVSVATNGGNTGAAWGFLGDVSGGRIALIIVSILMIIALFIFNYFVKNKSTFYCLAFGFVIGGAVGNLVDRLFLGYVRDFIYLDFFPRFPIFNFADSFLCVGAIMLAIYILFFSGKKKNDKTKS